MRENHFHTEFIATTGSSFAAERAGRNPAAKPITLEIISPVIIFPVVSAILNSVAKDTIRVPKKINNNPTTPPITESTIASKMPLISHSIQ